MQIRPLASRRSPPKTKPSSRWPHSPILQRRVPLTSLLEVWTLDAERHEIDRLRDAAGHAIVLLPIATEGELRALIEARGAGLYRVIARSAQGRICARLDFEAGVNLPPRDAARATWPARDRAEQLHRALIAEREARAMAESRRAAAVERAAELEAALAAEREAAAARVAAVEAVQVSERAAHAAQIVALEAELARCTAQLLRARMARRTRPRAMARADRAVLVTGEAFDAPEEEGARGKVRYARKRRDAAPRVEASAPDAERLLDLLERVLARATGAG